jgi:hypothetical protein
MTDSEALMVSAIIVLSILGVVAWLAKEEPACPREQKQWACRKGTWLGCECERR